MNQQVTEIFRDGKTFGIRQVVTQTVQNNYAVKGFTTVGMNGKLNRSQSHKILTNEKTQKVITVVIATKETAQKALNARIDNATIERLGTDKWVARINS